MPTAPEDVLAFRVGGATVGENLKRAIQSGVVLEREDGTLELPALKPGVSKSMTVLAGSARGCDFLNRFMFQTIYRGEAVPQGCAACYKIKVAPRTLRELVAMYAIARRIDCWSKWGLDHSNPHSPDLYAGYFYVTGLEGARALYPFVRDAVDREPKLGPDVPIRIKRGCSNYEVALGPSDSYSFQPEQLEIEEYLKRRFKNYVRPAADLAATLYKVWVPFAYRTGDETYLDFTNGRPLYPKSVNYDP
jgi:hypothetical protein